MAGGFGFPKYPQQKSPNPKQVGELLARASGHGPPQMPGQMPDMPGAPQGGMQLRPTGSGLPTQPTAAHLQSPMLGMRK